MREEYDMMEDVRIQKNKFVFLKGFIRTVIIGLVFLIFCGIFLSSAYSFMLDKMITSEKNSASTVDDSRKSYDIEQKLIRDAKNKLINDEEKNK